MNPHSRQYEFTEPYTDEELKPGDRLRDVPPGIQKESGKDNREGTTGSPAGKRNFRVRELIDGTILVRENMIRQLPFLIFLTFLGIIYIGNRFHAEHMVRTIKELKAEVGDLRAEQITTTSELMNISRPSEVAALVHSKNMGLKESLEPPKKLKRR